MIAVVLVLAVVAAQLLIGSYSRVLAGRADGLTADIQDLAGVIPTGDLDRLVVLDRQIKNLGTLLGTHVYFSRALDEVERLTLPQVRFISIGIDRSRALITIRGIAPSLDSLAVQSAAFSQSSAFSSVTVKNTSQAASGILFDLDLAFDQSLIQFSESLQ